MYSTTLERPIMTTAKQKEYTPMGEWDWTNLSEDEITTKIITRAKKAEEEFTVGNYQTAEEFFKEWDKERNRCVTR